jgi:hypothetical protein
MVKSVVVSPVIGAIWMLMDVEASLDGRLYFVPFIAALGFVATDLRVLLDARGQHAAAVWLKQGSLSLAIACPVICIILGLGFWMGVITSVIMRLFLTFYFLRHEKFEKFCANEFWELITSRMWMHLLLTSGIGSLAASVDRLLAVRFMTAPSAAEYVFVYELLSKFWLFPYLISPIVFVKVAQGDHKENYVVFSLCLIGLLGLPFVLLSFVLPNFLAMFIDVVEFSSWSMALFATTIVLASVNMVLAAQLQASGGEGATLFSATIGLFVSALAFPSLFHILGFSGIIWGWFFKTVAEGSALIYPKLKKRL